LWLIKDNDAEMLMKGTSRSIKTFLTKEKKKSSRGEKSVYGLGGLEEWYEDTTKEQVLKHNRNYSSTDQSYAQGGEIQEGDYVYVKPEELNAEVVRITGNKVVVEFIDRRPEAGDKRGNYTLKQLEKIDDDDDDMAKGGDYMADGGEIKYKIGDTFKRNVPKGLNKAQQKVSERIGRDYVITNINYDEGWVELNNQPTKMKITWLDWLTEEGNHTKYAKGGSTQGGKVGRFKILQDETGYVEQGFYGVFDTDNNELLDIFEFKKEAEGFVKELNDKGISEADASKFNGRIENYVLKNGGKVKSKKWIQEALSGGKNKGALRRTAKKKGLLRGDENLSATDLKKLQKMGGTTAKRAHLAETLRKLK